MSSSGLWATIVAREQARVGHIGQRLVDWRFCDIAADRSLQAAIGLGGIAANVTKLSSHRWTCMRCATRLKTATEDMKRTML